MGLRLHNLKPAPGAKKRRKRVGRGESSGKGKTSGKGHKGQKARSGGSIRIGFEGGQMPLYRRLPKRGFNNAQFKTIFGIVNLETLEAKFNVGDVINEQSLRERGILKGSFDGIKILGRGEITKKFSFEVDQISASAKDKVEKAGGKITLTAVKEETTSKSKK
ncbi:MAG: 50S ribosomal protein L15 [Chthoniobacterales bacterium]